MSKCDQAKAAHDARASFWRPSPTRLGRLVLGLMLFGFGDACLISADLGNSPWTVLAQGVSLNSPMSVGISTVAISFIVLLLWIPLRQPPGLGTIANAIGIGLTIQLSLTLLPDGDAVVVRWILMLGGVALVALGSGFYLTAALGPGPRDGLMTGFHRVTGLSLRLVRAAIELTVLVSGWLLGGTVGIGTVTFALAIGPGVQFAVEHLSTPEWRAIDRHRRVEAGLLLPSDEEEAEHPREAF